MGVYFEADDDEFINLLQEVPRIQFLAFSYVQILILLGIYNTEFVLALNFVITGYFQAYSLKLCVLWVTLKNNHWVSE